MKFHLPTEFRSTGPLLVLAGALGLACGLCGQSPAVQPQKSAGPIAQAAKPQMPANLQAQIDKLEEARKTAQAAGNAKAEATALNQIALLYFRATSYPAALDSYNQALTQARSASDPTEEAAAMNGIGNCLAGQGQSQKALDTYQQALDLATASGDARGQAAALIGIGWFNETNNQAQKALELLNRALALAQSAKDRDLEATALRRIGIAFFTLGDKPKALDSYNQALPIYLQVDDSDGEARTLTNIGLFYDDAGDKQKEVDYFVQAVPFYHSAGDRDNEDSLIENIGYLYTSLSQPQKALDYDLQVLAVYRQLGNRHAEANALSNIGGIYYTRGDEQKALDDYGQALTIYRQEGSRADEARTLTNLGNDYTALGEYVKALENYNTALPILHQLGDRKNEAAVASAIGNAYFKLGEQQKALDYGGQALVLQRAIADRGGESETLNNLGNVYSYLGEHQKALENYNQALPIQRDLGDRAGEARTLNNIGLIYSYLGDQQKALEFFNQALPIQRQVGDRAGEAGTLTNIGLAYRAQMQQQKALESYNDALPIFRQVGDRDDEAAVLADIGSVNLDIGQPQKALDAYNQVLPIFRELGDRRAEAAALTNVAVTYSNLGDRQKALDYSNQALPLAAAASDPLLEAEILYGLEYDLKDLQRPLATFYGKLAVNLLQQVRTNIQGLDKLLQSGFLASKDKYYHGLANVLIAQGRLPEAQQVLDLMKQQEYSDYVRGDTTNTLSPLTLTPAEQNAQLDYQKSTAQLVSVGEEWAQLKKVSARTPEQETRYQQLSAQLESGSKGLNDYYARLYVLFGKNSDANKQVADVKGDVSLLKQQIAKSPHTVALYTMVTSEGYKVIVITGSAMVEREYAISENELNQAVASFQQALRHPSGDPKPLAQQLYKILIGPVKADLDQAQAQTLVWSLDGVLRYVPMSALYDGKQYLIENYNTVTITPVSIAHLSEKPDVSNLGTLAMGISQKYEGGLPPLPSVVGELDDIVNDAQVQGAHGVLPGTILLDGQFTEKAMENKLDSPHGVVHIASHFVFKPGDDSQSYLLLAGEDEPGAGFHLTVANFRDNQKLALDDTVLLTLSACETGMSGNANDGREVDGLGMTAQLRGAKAVLSSLWEVNDASTGELMADFYKRWVEGAGNVAKVEALRQAQLDLLAGKVNPKAASEGRGLEAEAPTTSAPEGYAHPYYWAPFVLMGNWR